MVTCVHCSVCLCSALSFVSSVRFQHGLLYLQTEVYVWCLVNFAFCVWWFGIDCLSRLVFSAFNVFWYCSSNVSTFALSTVAFHQKFLQTEVVLFAVWSILPPCAVREPPSTLQQQATNPVQPVRQILCNKRAT